MQGDLHTTATTRVELGPLVFRPLTADTWDDFARLFGARGACGGCWCMYWHLTATAFDQQKGEANRHAMRARVDGGATPGLMVYAGGEPAGWCALGPREGYARLERSRTLARVDAAPVWSITCFFVARPFRRRGLSVALLRAAADFARERGAEILEGYPVEPKNEGLPDVFAWTGTTQAFLEAGFREVLRRSETRPIMRLELTAERPESSRAARQAARTERRPRSGGHAS